MNDAASHPSLSIGKLIVVPAVITLPVTILRLVGELENWAPPFLFQQTTVPFLRRS